MPIAGGEAEHAGHIGTRRFDREAGLLQGVHVFGDGARQKTSREDGGGRHG